MKWCLLLYITRSASYNGHACPTCKLKLIFGLDGPCPNGWLMPLRHQTNDRKLIQMQAHDHITSIDARKNLTAAANREPLLKGDSKLARANLWRDK
jgi:hypothetical protein